MSFGSQLAVSGAFRKRRADVDELAAALTEAAYPVALQHRRAGEWLDLELELWHTLRETIKRWKESARPSSE